MDWFLLFAIIVAFVILLVVAVYLLVHYSHPDDKNDAYLPKLTVILGFVIAGGTVLLLPLDVANNEGYAGCELGYDTKLCGGLNMDLFWNIFYWLIPIWVFILIPFMSFYYEADDGMLMAGTSVKTKPNSRICEAIKYEAFVVFIVGAIFAVCYLFLNDSKIPVREYIMDDMTNGANLTVTAATTNGGAFQTSQLADFDSFDTQTLSHVTRETTIQYVTVPVTVSTFFAGFMAFVGWFFFAVFGGIGLAALPLDLILAFVHRPRHMDAVEFAEAQMSTRERVNELVDIGELIKIERDEKLMNDNNGGKKGGMLRTRFSKDGKEERKVILEFKKAVYLLEQDVEDFQNCTQNYNSYNPLLPYAYLLLGFASIIISLFWIIHVIVYMLPNPPLTPFLNNYFKWFDSWFPLFGVLSVALFSVYLLLAALKGCFKFGLRFLCFQLHPMKVNKTYMSSFMFNMALVLLCALPVVQFCTTAFSDYARNTTVYQVMGTQVNYLQFFQYFWTNNIFVYALIIITLLTSIYLACKPRDTSKSSIELRDRLKARRG